ncbi:MAG TPA: protein kinase [Planctomycetota bacterium]|nr:protein kinase [Planctomycetota bacterium]
MKSVCPHCGYPFDAASGRSARSAVCPRCQRTFNAFAAGETIDLSAAPPPPAEPAAATPAGQADTQPHFHEYRILGELGRGGMGVVYRAMQETLERQVALKVIRAGEAAGADEVQRFLREAVTAAKLRHPNIVTVYELDVVDGIYYYTMEFIEGQDLGRLIQAGPLPLRRAVILTLKVARALAHAHAKGVVHRDLKPGNIILDEAGEPMVTDFGLALDLERGARSSAYAAGTPWYMAPEQISDQREAVGPACDVYALGTVLFEMLTGRVPFEGTSVEDIFEAITNREPPDPRAHRPEIDAALAEVCLTCLRKSPAQRWASAAELATTLAAWLARNPPGDAAGGPSAQ